LEGYLAQLKRADKLDFASWGGFAQNFAGRRIPFENADSAPIAVSRFQIYLLRAGFESAIPQDPRIVLMNNKPATLPGWAELSVEG
jgi:hypothetical protein